MTVHHRADQLQEALSRLPRVSLAELPTPLEEAPRLSGRLGVRVLFKRDDLTGLALGGNKVRKLEFLVGDAVEKGADTVVTTGGSQSNHARLTAAACRRAQLDCYLVLDRGLHPEQQGNLLLDELFGAHVTLLESDDPDAALTAMEELAESLRRQGRKPYIVPRGGSVPAGAVGYAAFVPELMMQVEAMDAPATWLYIATGSTGTHSGILAGLTAMEEPLPVQGISVSRPREVQVKKVAALAKDTLAHLGVDNRLEDEANVDDGYVGPGYGHPTAETMEAIQLVAQDEGIVLDPVYTGKAIAGLIGHARQGRFAPDDVIVFVHTGGTPALFAYHREMSEALGASQS